MKNPITWFIRYVQEARAEMGKVTWPSRAETVKYSALTVAISLLVAAFFWGLDTALKAGLTELINLTA